jgi:hypothetical protein
LQRRKPAPDRDPAFAEATAWQGEDDFLIADFADQVVDSLIR